MPINTCGVSNIRRSNNTTFFTQIAREVRYNWFMLVTIAVTILSILIFLFLFWKRLKEDYSAEIIFKAAIYILFGILIGWSISVNNFPAWFFWTSFAGGLIGLTFAILRLKVRFYETLEAFIISSLPGLSLIFLSHSATRGSLNSFLAFVIILIMVFVSYYFDTHYKRFTWYKSGKIGFAGVAVAVLFFLVRTAVAIAKVTMLSFVGSSEVILSGLMTIIGFVMLVNLGKIKK